MSMTLDELIAAHPILQNVVCGVSVPQGWIPIVDEAATALTAIGGVCVDQIKQKFGGLRIYARAGSHDDAAVSDVIVRAVAKAETTCERCGSTDQAKIHTSKRGFMENLCAKHRLPSL